MLCPRPRQTCNCLSVKIAKNSQEGRINQCFYFDKASDKRLYIQPLEAISKIGFWFNEIFPVCCGHGDDC